MPADFYMVVCEASRRLDNTCLSMCVLRRTAGQLLNLDLGKEADVVVDECQDIQDRNAKERPDAGLVGLQREKVSSGATECESLPAGQSPRLTTDRRPRGTLRREMSGVGGP